RRQHRRGARYRKSAARGSRSGVCHPQRARGAGRRARRVVRGIRNSAGTGDRAVARQARRRCRARSAWPSWLADAGMGTLGAELPQAAGTRARQSSFAKPLSRAMILFWSSLAASVLAVVGCGYLITAAILVGRFARDRASACSAAAPAVTVLKPLHGDEPGLFDNLTSFCVQNYPGRMQIVCGVQDAADDAIALVERLREVHADRDLDLVIETKVHGLNRKVSNLVNMAPRIRHDVVVLADSDMRVNPDYLSRIVAALAEPGIGAVTCLYSGVAVTGIWARLCALIINAQFLPSVVVGLALGLARPCFGSTLALRRTTLAEIGGFQPFADCLADDYAIGAALRAHGCKIAIPPFAVAHICTQMSLRELWRHELRWARTVRSIDPVGYAGSIISHALPWALIAALAGVGSPSLLPAIGIALAAIACRMALLRQVEGGYSLPPRADWVVGAGGLFFVARVAFLVFWLGGGWESGRPRGVGGGGWGGGGGGAGGGLGACGGGHSTMTRRLFRRARSSAGCAGGAGARYQSRRETQSCGSPTWLAHPAALVEGSKLIDATPHRLKFQDIAPEA